MKSDINYFIYSKMDFTKKSAAQTRMQYYARALSSGSDKVFLLSNTSGEIDFNQFDVIGENIYLLRPIQKTWLPWYKFRFMVRMFQFSQQLTGKSVFICYPTAFLFFELIALIYLKGIRKQTVFLEFNEVRKYAPRIAENYNLFKPIYSFKKLVFLLTSKLSLLLLRYYDGIICISTAIQAYAERYNKHTIRIPILTAPEILQRTSSNSYISKGKFNIGFAGSIYHTKENIDSFIDQLGQLYDAGYPVAFNLCGRITKRYRSDFLAKCKQYSWLSYYGKLNDIELSTFLSQQNLLVIPRGNTLQNQYGFSTKLSDYLNHKKLILATDVSDIRLYIKDGYNGFIVPPDNPVEMKKKLIYIMENHLEIGAQIAHNAFMTSQSEFDYSTYSEPMKKFLLPR